MNYSLINFEIARAEQIEQESAFTRTDQVGSFFVRGLKSVHCSNKRIRETTRKRLYFPKGMIGLKSKKSGNKGRICENRTIYNIGQTLNKLGFRLCSRLECSYCFQVGQRVTPVSYTHLDVYKRQHQFPKPRPHNPT